MNEENNLRENTEKKKYWEICLEKIQVQPKDKLNITVFSDKRNEKFDNLDSLLNFVKNNPFDFVSISWDFFDLNGSLTPTNLNYYPVDFNSFNNDTKIKQLVNDLNAEAAKNLYKKKYPDV